MLVTVPRVLRERLGDEGSDALVVLINEAADGIQADALKLLEERFERRLAEELAKVRQEITALEARLEAKMAALRADIIKWMFLFWVGQLTVMTGLFLAFFRH